MKRLALLFVAVALQCCSTSAPNPSFPLTVQEARLDFRRMRNEPMPLARPVIVVGGYYDPGIAAHRVAERLRGVTNTPDLVLQVVFWSNATFETCRARLLEEIESAFPSGTPSETVDVDIVGISMGGLIARYAAAEIPGGKRLRIDRLFTISTPHLGADMATLPTMDERQIDMRAGSAFLAELDGGSTLGSELVCYVRLGDAIVGARNCAPEGESLWWVPNKPFEFAHMEAHHDDRILADIARRLRGESPFTVPPAAPLPQE